MSQGLYRSLIILSAISGSQQVLAAPVLSASLTSGIDFTDNATFVSENKQESAALRIEPELSAADKGASTSYRFNYRFQSLSHRPDSKLNESNHFLNAFATKDLFDNRLQSSAGYNISQVRSTSSASNVSGTPGGSGYQEAQQLQGKIVLDTPKNRYFDFESYIDGQMSLLEESKRDSESLGAGFNLTSGYWLSRSYWAVFGESRLFDGNSQQSAQSDRANALGGFHLFQDIFIRGQSSYESVETGRTGEPAEEFRSLGAGLEWRPTRRSHFAVTYNWVPEEYGDNFVGGEFAWKPSDRFDASGNYTHRFYGHAYSLQMTHTTRHLRSTINYSENVSNFASFSSETNETLLICPNTSTATLGDCRLPADASDVAKPGEVAISVPGLISDVTDGVKLVKQLRASSAYQYGKSTYTLGYSLQSREDIGVSISPTSHQQGVDFTWNLLLFSNTNLSLLTKVAKVEEKTGGSLNQKYLDQSYGIQLVHQLNARTSISAKYNHLFRNDKLNDSYRENSIATALMVKF
ncbi:MAG: TIGR03016 family PEP-CTERM system-associated outer membrane protein [Hahellaceae bacterium]|nr:TIGR03016 family PEP-CTERM system-associated outer membrane protein [Hahellaceae bacterium]